MEDRPQPRPNVRRALLLALLACLIATVLSSDAPVREGAGGETAAPRVPLGPVWLELSVLDAEGQPAPGASVSIRSLAEGGRLLWRGAADSEGHLRLRGRRGRRVQVRARLEGHAVLIRVLPLQGEHVLRLGRGERLFGRITDAEGAPIPGARAHLRWDEEIGPGAAGPAFELETDDEGRFVTTEAPARTLTVIAVAPGYKSERRRLSLPLEEAEGEAGEGAAELRFVLRLSAVIAGRVVGDHGRPEVGARVSLVGSAIWPAREARTDRSGRFLFYDLPEGVYELRARGAEAGVAEPRRGVELEEGGRLYFTFFLREGGAQAPGRVVDARTDQPIEDARIMITSTSLDAAPRAASSDAHGRFTLSGLGAAAYQVRAEAEGYAPELIESWRPGESLTIRMHRGATISGRVLGEDGRPLEGVAISILGETQQRAPIEISQPQAEMSRRVFMTHLNAETDALAEALGPLPVLSGHPVPEIPSESDPSLSDPSLSAPGAEPPTALPPPPPEVAAALVRTFHTDAWGRFSLSGIPPGGVQVVARLPGYAPAATPRIEVDEGVEREGIELVLHPSGHIAGVVLDARGDPAAEVIVELRSDREAHARATRTGDRGEFEFEDAFGAVVLTAMAQDQPPVRVQAEVGSRERIDVEIRLLEALHTLYGRTVDERGFPIAGTLIQLRSLDPGTPFERHTQSEADGTFTLSGLPPPPYDLRADHPDRAVAHLPEVRNFPRPPEYVTVTLPLGAGLSGQVVGERSGAAIPGTQVAVSDEGLPPRTFSASVDAEGRWSVARVPAGRWFITATAPGHLPARIEATLAARSFGLPDVETDPIELVEAGVLLGTVVDPLGDPVSRATVSLVGVEGGPEARTDASGRFRLAGVPEGIVDVQASHPAGGVGVYERVRAVAGEQTPGLIVRLPRRLDYDAAESAPGRVVGVALELVDGDRGVEILHVGPGSAATRAGLRAGDRLLSVDGNAVEDAEQGATLLRGPSGVAAQLIVVRNGSRSRLRVQREAWWPIE